MKISPNQVDVVYNRLESLNSEINELKDQIEREVVYGRWATLLVKESGIPILPFLKSKLKEAYVEEIALNREVRNEV